MLINRTRAGIGAALLGLCGLTLAALSPDLAEARRGGGRASVSHHVNINHHVTASRHVGARKPASAHARITPAVHRPAASNHATKVPAHIVKPGPKPPRKPVKPVRPDAGGHNHINNIDIHNDIDVDIDDNHHPWATGAVVATGAVIARGAAIATSAAIGAVIYSLPPSCQTTVVNGISYWNCSGVWYRPQYYGSDVTYVVVDPPA